MNPNWRCVPGSTRGYEVSSMGETRRRYKNGKVRTIRPFLRVPKRGSKRMTIKVDLDGIYREYLLTHVILRSFGIPIKEGYSAYLKNGMHTDTSLGNMSILSKKDLGKLTGHQSCSRPVRKINESGEVVAFYRSAREAARLNFMSPQTVNDHCNGVLKKKKSAPDGYRYEWDNGEYDKSN